MLVNRVPEVELAVRDRTHIIGHFRQEELPTFLNAYLDRLTVGGLVVIFTPLPHQGFYDDFDHVKPYPPGALRQLFCGSAAQTSGFRVHGEYVEVGLWFKRTSLWHSHRAGLWTHLFALPLSLACTLSFGLIGRTTGYGLVLQRTA